jgi:hypothetical protein
MKKPISMKKFVKFINALLILAILGVLTLEVKLLFVQAQDAPVGDDAAVGDEADETPEKDVGGKCAQQIKNFMAVQKVEFGDFINKHFQSAKPTSELIPAAIEKYRGYREEVRIKIKNFIPEGGKVATVANTERAGCEKAVEEDFALMKDLIRQHILENAYAKKSTRFIDKYKEINEKLERLNFTIAQMYGYFAALSQKLPCYADKCVH